jgi:hypothetical protein
MSFPVDTENIGNPESTGDGRIFARVSLRGKQALTSFEAVPARPAKPITEKPGMRGMIAMSFNFFMMVWLLVLDVVVIRFAAKINKIMKPPLKRYHQFY